MRYCPSFAVNPTMTAHLTQKAGTLTMPLQPYQARPLVIFLATFPLFFVYNDLPVVPHSYLAPGTFALQ